MSEHEPAPLELREFLTAQLDEIEQQARKDSDTHEAEWILKEVEAVRRIIRAHDKHCGGHCEAPYPDAGLDAGYYWAMKVHAAVYEEHPGYRPEWHPDYGSWLRPA